ncbi:CD3324 family protein [Virgibacillus doumboii]|uniref:CD3324 family protein n=1 Tax=Virgibacillus doumboii TaxID=2697503 RepID=UPI0013E0D9D8|nr:CD3324 family protein [Virgibacillus doumboii]
MAYIQAKKVLPEELIVELQNYIQGETVYIPKKKDNYQGWGTCSGGRKLIDQRNTAIKNAFDSGESIGDLAREYCLSIETVKKIVYKK